MIDHPLRIQILKNLDVKSFMLLSGCRDENVAEISMHKARTWSLEMTEEEKQFSRDWLHARNMSEHFGGKVK